MAVGPPLAADPVFSGSRPWRNAAPDRVRSFHHHAIEQHVPNKAQAASCQRPSAVSALRVIHLLGCPSVPIGIVMRSP